ncbi:RecB family exonuclease [Candidatus Poribacteria bacterium]
MLNLKEDRSHFSFSQLSTMLMCPYKYYLQYVERRGWDIVPSAVSFGGAMHKSIQIFHNDLKSGTASGNGKYSDEFRSLFSEDADGNNVVFKDDSEFEKLLGKGELLIAEYTNSFSQLRPSEVEMEFRLPLVNTYTGDLLDKDVVGKIDMISESGEIYELKTGSSALPRSAVDENLQLILYGWSYKMIFGRAPQKLILVNLVKTKQPKIQVLDTTIDGQKERKLMHLMFRVNEAIDKECFYPNPRGMFGCGGCTYSLSCEYAF